MEVSVVIPCLNEEKTIDKCISKAKQSFKEAKLKGEVIVVDNGSTDKSIEIAKSLGAKVVEEVEKGYGSALRRGINEAQGKYIVMGDGDDTYDFSELNKFISLLKQGDDLVMGSRFRGKFLPGSMTWSHRYIGNPILSGMLKLFFGGKVSDAHCGLRAFTKKAYQKMDLKTTGMEFASEMVIHALKKKLKIDEIPITYYPRVGESKLASFRDAWRHIRFMLLYSPGYLFILPGLLIFLLNFAAVIRFMFGPLHLFGRDWGIHVLIFNAIFTILGWQIFSIGLAAKIYAYSISLEEGIFIKHITLEKALFLGLSLFLIGIGMIMYIFYAWSLTGFGELRQINTGIIALIMTAIGLQTIFTAFLSSMLQIKYK